jgi:hypothetical protein
LHTGAVDNNTVGMVSNAGAHVGNYATNKSISNQMKKLKDLEQAADVSARKTIRTIDNAKG